MKTIEYIKEHGLNALKDNLGINIKFHDSLSLVCLTYDQIESPKAHEVVKECRGLILEVDKWKIVFRCMPRFFNYGEQFTQDLDYSDAIYYEKLDGSLIKIYNYNDHWYIATKSTVEGVQSVGDFGLNYKELVFKTLNVENDSDFQDRCDWLLDKSKSYNFELTTPENRVVTPVTNRKLSILNVIDTESGKFEDYDMFKVLYFCHYNIPEGLSFENVNQAIEYVNKLPDLQEGLVAYINGVPVCKIKSDKYVQAHHLKTGFSIKNVKLLVLMQEHEEYISYFPEDANYFEKFVYAFDNMFGVISQCYKLHSSIFDQKEFALAVKDYKFKGLLFSKRKNPDKSFRTLFNECTENTKLDLLDYFVEFYFGDDK